jgi:rod shape-determining protein MreC
MIKRLYDIFRAFKEYLLAGSLIAVSFALLALNDTRQIRSIRSHAVVAIGVLQGVVNTIPAYFNLRQENAALRDMNVALSDEVSRLREARLENIRLRELVGLQQKPAHHYRSATVVGKSLQLLRNTVTLNVGERDGVRVQMPIVSESGLVGKIIFTESRYSVGQILLNRDVRVSAKVQRSRVDGIIQWDGGETLILRNVAKSLDVQPGDVVITSDYSSLFPPGIKIGTVLASTLAPGSLFRSINVAPSVDFARLEEVFVVLSTPDSTRLALEGRAKSYSGEQ